MRHFATATAIAALMFAAPAVAQQQNQGQQQQQQQAQSQQKQGQLSQQDREFAKTAAAGGMLEVRLGEIAQEKAQNQQVKQFGQRMVEDHQQANDKLMTIVRDLKIDAPKNLPQDKQQTIQRFEGMEGQQFDKAYMQFMVEDHQKVIEAFNKEVEQGQNQELKSFAQNTLPTLEEHLNQAREVSQQIGAMAQSGQGQEGQQSQQQAMAGGQGDNQTEVVVDQAPAEAIVDPAAPNVTVVDPEPRVKVEVPEPQVTVNQPEPQVRVDQADPQVDIQRQGQADVTIVERDTQQTRTQMDQQAQSGQTQERQQNQQAQSGQMQRDQEQAVIIEDEEQRARQQQAMTGGQNLQELVGQPVYGQNGEQVGEISEVLMSPQGNQVERVVLDRGGFLGMGEAHIAIDFQDLEVTNNGIRVNMTDEQIAEMPEYEGN